jgi:hypothetical protein
MEAQTTLVRSKGAVHLDPIAAVYLDLPFVINPRNAELNHPLRLNDAFEDFAVPIFFVALDGWFDGFDDFGYRLKELRLIRIALFNDVENFLDKTRSDFHFYRLFSSPGSNRMVPNVGFDAILATVNIRYLYRLIHK